jgi:trehalose 6-phosphate phosphatase
MRRPGALAFATSALRGVRGFTEAVRRSVADNPAMQDDMVTTDVKPRLDAFMDRVEQARERVLMLDYDGTLAPLRVKPQDAVPYPSVADSLHRLRAASATRIVIVSGRAMASLDPLIEGLPYDEVWACHGWQRRFPGRPVVNFRATPQVMDELHAASLAAAPLTKRGARLECKPASIALHWRGLDHETINGLRQDVAIAWQGGGSDGVEILPFDGGVEMRARGRDKGEAVRTVLGATGSGAACAYLGDDVADEDAFAAIAARGLGVLVRNVDRPTRAHTRVSTPHGVCAFLDAWAGASRRNP